MTNALEIPSPTDTQEEILSETKVFPENLTSQELEERDRNIKIIKGGVARWVEENKIEKKCLDKKQLSLLVEFLHESYPDAIYAITDLFINREKYVERPAVLIYEAGKDPIDIDIYLLGWRSPIEKQLEIGGEPEGVPTQLATPDYTYIHDHEATYVAIKVLEYDPVTEVLYLTPYTETSNLPEPQKKYYDPRLPIEQRSSPYEQVIRQFYAGSNLQVGAPYIHKFAGPSQILDHGMAVTMHAYSTSPEAIPKSIIPEGHEKELRKGGLYKMNYFMEVTNTDTGKKELQHVGYYILLEDPIEGRKLVMDGVVEGVTKQKDLPEQRGKFIFC
ncbi:MAG: hypothetical protein HY506_01840 [Candidatus Yanofskybacteria bacterium]|nr:hypothetical protein [Candidatus Yanofskybacteria bacterium]